MMSEIDKIINHSSRRELIEFLEDNSFELDSAVLLYQKAEGDYGFRKLEGSNDATLTGILAVITEVFKRHEADLIEESLEEKDED